MRPLLFCVSDTPKTALIYLKNGPNCCVRFYFCGRLYLYHSEVLALIKFTTSLINILNTNSLKMKIPEPLPRNLETVLTKLVTGDVLRKGINTQKQVFTYILLGKF